MKNKKVLVIGGSGFLGSNLSELLIEKKYKVTIFDKKKINLNGKYQFLKGDIKNFKRLSSAIKGKDYIYFFAGMGDITECLNNPVMTIKQNILSVLNIMELASRFKIKRFIFASTIYIHSSQGSFYRVSKHSAELYIDEFARRNNLKYTILRYGTVYGPKSDMRNSIYNIITKAIKNRKIIYRGTKKSVRRFIHVKDASLASIDILKKKFENKKVVITGVENTKLVNLCENLKKKFDIKKKIIFQNNIVGHYDKNHYISKPNKEIIYKFKKYIKLNKGIEDLIKKINNNH